MISRTPQLSQHNWMKSCWTHLLTPSGLPQFAALARYSSCQTEYGSGCPQYVSTAFRARMR